MAYVGISLAIARAQSGTGVVGQAERVPERQAEKLKTKHQQTKQNKTGNRGSQCF